MIIGYLREFLAVTQLGNFSMAADELFMSASSLSKHISALEAELGVKLFDRTTRAVSTSRYGEILIPFAIKIIEQEDAFHEKLLLEASENENVLRIASLPMLAHYGITEMLSSFRDKNPTVNLQISETENREVSFNLSRGICDVAFTGFVPEGMENITISVNPIVAVLPSKHPLSRESVLQLQQLRNEKFLFLDENTGIFSICIDACAEAGFKPCVVYKSHRPENILKFVSQGMGVALMMTPLVEFFHLSDISCVGIDPPLKAYVHLAWNGKPPLKPIVKKFLHYILSRPNFNMGAKFL